MTIRSVILSGGSGTRLWPASRKSLPKQFIEFPGTGSLFARTLERATAIGGGCDPLIISSKAHGFLCRRAASGLGLTARYIFEETGRNTAPAIFFAALASEPGDALLVMPSDHWIEDTEAFATMAVAGEAVAAGGGWVTFGVTPDAPVTGYGYISTSGAGDVLEVQSFMEKPDPTTAQSYLDAGGYFWNSGIFMVQADACLESFQRHAPDLASAAKTCWETSLTRDDETILPKPALERIPSISVDYAILEKESRISLLPFSGRWSDVGSWDFVWKISEKDENGNVIEGNVIAENTQNSFLSSNKRLVAVIGLKDLVVIETSDAIMVADKKECQRVKDIVKILKLINGK